MYTKYVKRILDFVFAMFLLIITFPIMLLASIAIKLEDPKGPVLFKQDRLGLNGQIFKIYKFRSMVVDAEKKGTGVYSFKDDPRVTRVGRFIRKTSIDELPQLFNIIKGEMSLIGPRPPLVNHPWSYEEYSKHQKRRFEMLPGLTGWAQINGRKQLTWEERIELDIDYVNNVSFLFDLKIFIKTFPVVLFDKNNVNTIITNKTSKKSN